MGFKCIQAYREVSTEIEYFSYNSLHGKIRYQKLTSEDAQQVSESEGIRLTATEALWKASAVICIGASVVSTYRSLYATDLLQAKKSIHRQIRKLSIP